MWVKTTVYFYWCEICKVQALEISMDAKDARSVKMKIDNPKVSKSFACPECFDNLPKEEQEKYITYRVEK